MIDLHCHILPGVDDGPGDAGESLRMAEKAAEDGIRTIVATPHTQNGVHVNDLDSILLLHTRLNALMRSRSLGLDILPGAEVRIHRDMLSSVQQGRLATLNNGRCYLLVEFPHNVILPGTRDVLYQLTAHGITPVLAHPERNEAIQRNPDLLTELVNLGCLVQLTAMSITGELGRAAMAAAHRMLVEQQAHVVASDAHDPIDRPPLLSVAVEAAADVLGDPSLALALVTQNPRAILDGKPLARPDPSPEPAPKSRLSRWFGRRRRTR